MNTVLTVARREVDTRMRSRSFAVITLIMVLAVVGIVVIFYFISGTTATEKVGLTPAAAALQQPLESAATASGQHVHVIVIDQQAGTDMVRDGKLSALLSEGAGGRLTAVVGSSLTDNLKAPFTLLARQTALDQQITALGGDPAKVGQAVAAATVDVQPLHPENSGRGAQIGVSSVTGVLIYVMLLISVQLTGQGVVEEKANRIVEILLATIRPWQLLAGKVLGIGLVTISQVVVLAVAGGVAAQVSGVVHLSASVVTGSAAWAVVWYLLGYFLFALIIAGASSLVSRQEDVASVGSPVTIVLIASYIVGTTVLQASPHGTATTVLSMIPFFAPVMMPMRVVYGVPGWEMAVALAVTIALIALVARIAGRVYSNAVLYTGSRVRLRAALSPLPRR